MFVDLQTAISYPDPTPTGYETFSNPSRPPWLKSRNGKHCVTPARAAAREGDVAGTESEEEQATMPFFLNFDRQLQNYVYVHHTVKWICPHYVANVSLQQGCRCQMYWIV